ncbi:MAG: hypothetical protein Q8916_09535, partial [Bacteroidota bacterium]|nr:hypothetical protein [Bacteroidota bacterium]
AYIMDYRFNKSMKNDLRKAIESNSKDVEKYHLSDLIANRKSETPSIIYTESHDAFRGYKFIIGDTKHTIISTDWGEIYFPAKEISDKELFSDFDSQEPDPLTIARIPRIPPKDPMASQGFVTPNGIAFGKGSFFLSDFLLGGLQFNYGPFDWLSANLGGVFLPLRNSITVATGGLKFTPYSSEKWHVSAGVQGMYSQVIKTTHLALGYGALTYGSWESQLTLFAGYTVNHTDSLGYKNTKNDELLIVQGMKQVGVNVKLGVELFFISNFEIVPLLATIRYFTDRFTIDVGAVLSLYKAGAVRTTKTLAEYVFDTPDVPVIPVFSFSYHF